MKADYINPFLSAIENVLGQFGMTELRKGDAVLKEEMVIEQDVTVFIGIVGDIRGNIAYSFTNRTAKNMASVMMMGMPVGEWDEMSRSAVAELANMFVGTAGTILANHDTNVDITPPSVVMGEAIYLVLSSVQTFSVTMETPQGNVEVNICLEI